MAAVVDEAPFLTEYYEMANQMMGDAMPKDAAGFQAISAKDPKEFEEEIAGKIREKARPLLEKSFDHHDKDKNGVLDKDEAALFFTHMMDRGELFLEKITKTMETSVITSLKSMFQQMGLPTEAVDQQIAPIEQKFKEAVDLAKPMIKEMIENYKANKVERDAAAFKVADTDGNGTLIKEEFFAAMLPKAENNEAFLKALGFNKEEIEAKLKAAMGG